MLTISICQASFKSGTQSIEVRNKWFERAKNSNRVEHCLGFEENDQSILDAYEIDLRILSHKSSDGKTKYKTTPSLSTPSGTRNWNAAASISTGEFILLIADDLIPEYGWDESIEKYLNKNGTTNGIFKFTDDRCNFLNGKLNDTLLPRHPGFLRSTYKKLGYVFDPGLNSTGPDLDLLILSLTTGTLHDLRFIKLHHSIGKILNSDLDLICGCYGYSQNISPKRTVSQLRMHSESKSNIKSFLVKKWGWINYSLAYFACINRLSDHLIIGVKPNTENNSVAIIIKGISRYVLYKFFCPSFWSGGIDYLYRKVIPKR